MYTTILRICVMALAWAVTVANAHGPDGAKHEMAQLGDMTFGRYDVGVGRRPQESQNVL
jgi:hypothetical protein